MQASFTDIRVCMRACVCVRKHSPRLHAALQRLQARLDEVEGLEKQRGAGPTEGATHEGFDSWVSLGGEEGYDER